MSSEADGEQRGRPLFQRGSVVPHVFDGVLVMLPHVDRGSDDHPVVPGGPRVFGLPDVGRVRLVTMGSYHVDDVVRDLGCLPFAGRVGDVDPRHDGHHLCVGMFTTGPSPRRPRGAIQTLTFGTRVVGTKATDGRTAWLWPAMPGVSCSGARSMDDATRAPSAHVAVPTSLPDTTTTWAIASVNSGS